MFLDGNRTHLPACAECSDAVELPSSITEAQRPIQLDDGQEARWESISCLMARGLNPLAVPRLPITQIHRPV